LTRSIISSSRCVILSVSRLLVDGADLFQQDDRVPVKTVGFRIDLHMGRQFGFLDLGGDRGDDDGGAKPVPDIVLNDENRAHPTLFRSYNRRKIGKIHIATLNDQALTPR